MTEKVMTLSEIKDFMNDKGFTMNSITGDRNVATFIWDKGMDNNTAFACEVNVKEQSFKFLYVCGMTKLCQGPMTPISSPTHFSKMANHFYARVEVLAKHFES